MLIPLFRGLVVWPVSLVIRIVIGLVTTIFMTALKVVVIMGVVGLAIGYMMSRGDVPGVTR
jgi:hypothetical protein